MELQFHLDPARKLSSDLYNTYQCRMYSGKLLMMGRETARNMQSFVPEKIWKLVHPLVSL